MTIKKALIWFFFLWLIYFAVSGFTLFQKGKLQTKKQNLPYDDTSLFSRDRMEQEKQKCERTLQECKQKQSEERVYTILLGGDLMLDRGVKKVIHNLHKDYHFPFEKIRDYLHRADLVFANLEGSLSSVGKDVGNKYSFRFEVPVAQALADVGFDIVSTANNHMLDWGKKSLCATRANLKKVGIRSVGSGCNYEEANREEIVQLGNIRIAFLAYTEFHKWGKASGASPGLSDYSIDNIIRKARGLKDSHSADLVFVSLHWGGEYKDRAPKRIVQLAHQLIDGGVDLIIGHHPHVDQEIERYKNGWIIYSLGNFVFDQSWSKNTMEGLLVEVKLQNKKILNLFPHFMYLNKFYQPELES